MKRFFSSILLFICLASSASAFELSPHTATYTANIKKGIKIKGKAVRELKRLDESTWHYSFDVRSFAADIDESVTFSLLDDRITPQKYRYKLDPAFGRTKRASANFDWATQSVAGSNKEKKWSINNIPSNTYDRLSYQLQLLKDIGSEKFNPKYEIAHKAKLRPSAFEVVGTELLDTQLGKVETVLVKKIRAKDNKRQTHLWLSKKHPLLLIKMEQKEVDGEEYVINIESAVINDQPISFSSDTVSKHEL